MNKEKTKILDLLNLNKKQNRREFLRNTFTTGSVIALGTMTACTSPIGSNSVTQAYMSFEINFNLEMNTASVESAISVTPAIDSFPTETPVWSNDNKTVTYLTLAADTNTEYTVNINPEIAGNSEGVNITTENNSFDINAVNISFT